MVLFNGIKLTPATKMDVSLTMTYYTLLITINFLYKQAIVHGRRGHNVHTQEEMELKHVQEIASRINALVACQKPFPAVQTEVIYIRQSYFAG